MKIEDGAPEKEVVPGKRFHDVVKMTMMTTKTFLVLKKMKLMKLRQVKQLRMKSKRMIQRQWLRLNKLAKNLKILTTLMKEWMTMQCSGWIIIWPKFSKRRRIRLEVKLLNPSLFYSISVSFHCWRSTSMKIQERETWRRRRGECSTLDCFA